MKQIFLFLMCHSVIANAALSPNNTIDVHDKLNKLETSYQRHIGLYAYDSNSNKVIAYNENQRFPFQSTFKLVGVAAFLYQNQKKPVLDKKVIVKPEDIVPWGPISHQYLNKPVSYKTLGQAAIAYSDNTAINLIIKKMGGVKVINKFMKKIDNDSFQLNHLEIHLNSSLKIKDDTSTPQDMGTTLSKLFNTNVLNNKSKMLLKKWLKNNTTGNDMIRAGLPLGWSVADKTGSGKYGVANDLGFVWSPGCKSVILSIYTAGTKKPLSPNSKLIADITKLTLNTFANYHSCYQLTDISIEMKES